MTLEFERDVRGIMILPLVVVTMTSKACTLDVHSWEHEVAYLMKELEGNNSPIGWKEQIKRIYIHINGRNLEWRLALKRMRRAQAKILVH